jgi:hypothetical protein
MAVSSLRRLLAWSSLTVFAAPLVLMACSDGEEPKTETTADAGGTGRDPGVQPAVPAAPNDAGATQNDAAVGTPGKGPDVAADVAEFATKISKSICAKLDSCCADEERTAFFQRFFKAERSPFTLTEAPSAEACEATLKDQLSKQYDIWVGSVARGMMTFDKAKAGECAAKLEAAACGVDLAVRLDKDHECFDSRRGSVWKRVGKIGAACRPLNDGVQFFTECDQKLGFCQTSDPEGKPLATPVCFPWSKQGEECRLTGRGKDARFCDPDLDCSDPFGGVCMAPPAAQPPAQNAGDTCIFPDYSTAECPANTFCDGFRTRTCVAQLPDGEACVAAVECQQAHWGSCISKKCNTKGFCAGKPAAPADGGN